MHCILCHDIPGIWNPMDRPIQQCWASTSCTSTTAVGGFGATTCRWNCMFQWGLEISRIDPRSAFQSGGWLAQRCLGLYRMICLTLICWWLLWKSTFCMLNSLNTWEDDVQSSLFVETSWGRTLKCCHLRFSRLVAAFLCVTPWSCIGSHDRFFKLLPSIYRKTKLHMESYGCVWKWSIPLTWKTELYSLNSGTPTFETKRLSLELA